MTTSVMKAALVERYGPPQSVRIATRSRPEPRPNEVLVAVRATTVSAADWRIRSASVPRGFGLMVRLAFGLRGPRRRPVLGTELSGVVVEVGERVTRFRVGDRVFAFTGSAMGAHAEYVALSANGNILPLPDEFGFAEGAAICFGGMTALYFLRDAAKLQAGERVLVVGAAGSVGSAAVELAKHFGAHVTGVTSGRNVAFVEELGADHVIDYERQDFSENGERYDVIMDCVGTAPFERAKRSLNPGGRLLLVVGTLGQLLAARWQSRSGLRVIGGGSPERVEDMATLAELCQQGAFRPRIGASFPFADIASAHALVEGRHKRGNVVLLLPGA